MAANSLGKQKMSGVKTIVLPATLDTKGGESSYLKREIKKAGFRVITIHMRTGARGSLLSIPDVPQEQVGVAVGVTREDILALGSPGKESRLMELSFPFRVKILRGRGQNGTISANESNKGPYN